MGVMEIIAAVALTIGLGVGGYGLYLRTKDERPATLSPAAFKATMRDAVGLAVEMCRADGQINDIEIEAIRAFLREHAPDLGDDFADREINVAIRSTIVSEKIKGRALAVRKRVQLQGRVVVLDLVQAVAMADGALSEGEKRYLYKLGGWLGFPQDALEQRTRSS